MLDVLPSEVALNVFAYLPVQSIAVLLSVSRPWANFMSANESVIYRQAAVFHNFISMSDSARAISDVMEKYKGQLWDSIRDWKEFCEYNNL
jgi:hypothetical protein